jgi:hypothetical protein
LKLGFLNIFILNITKINIYWFIERRLIIIEKISLAGKQAVRNKPTFSHATFCMPFLAKSKKTITLTPGGLCH